MATGPHHTSHRCTKIGSRRDYSKLDHVPAWDDIRDELASDVVSQVTIFNKSDCLSLHIINEREISWKLLYQLVVK